jgi:hypothetical protein
MPRLPKVKQQPVTTRISRKPKSDERAIVLGLPRRLPLSRDIKPTISELDLSSRQPKSV